MKVLDLDLLLGSTYPAATFHDSRLQAIETRFDQASAKLRFRIPVAESGRHVKYAAGTLTLSGLLFIASEPPRSKVSEWAAAPLWITSDGPFPGPGVSCSFALPLDLPAEAFCHYFFASNTNAFVIVAATGAEFSWEPITPA